MLVQIGDHVQYLKKFLKSICTSTTDSIWFLKGRITRKKADLYKVAWEDGHSSWILEVNLSKVGTNEG